MPKLIEDYQVKMVEAGCAPGSGRYGLEISLSVDISEALPYLNGTVKDAVYDHQNHILILREAKQAYAFYPKEIKVARVEDASQAFRVAGEVVDRVNRVWEDRDHVKPCLIERRVPTVMDIFKLLPRTNCKKCGLVTCLAYASALRTAQAGLADCPCLTELKHEANRKRLESILNY